MFNKRSANYIQWDEYKKMVDYRERLLFMQDTVLKSLRNHFEKAEKGVMLQ